MKTCTQCGETMTSDSPEGLCARCLLSVGMQGNGSDFATLDAASTDSGRAHGVPSNSSAIGDVLGKMIGPYKVLQQIGEGGFGTVFMAEQQFPVRRKVALKIIKLGMDTRQVVARFEAERQALAIMDHPNIAKVLDAGATDTGRPFFVMELVRGVPITDYCDVNTLSVPERLELFVKVCAAVQHAHQKGIIHRDIKPTNVLVAMGDGKPAPKVIDFGIAKATDQRLTEKTLFTEFRQMIGTPEYMSPEQAEMAGIDIDTRTDVYSLGVLLYELLVGSTPFDPKELRSKAYAEIQRWIREVEPPRPSTRLSTMAGAMKAVAAHRRIEPAKLGQILKGELDWVVMRAMEKDRVRRYDTAIALGADVGRYLAGEAVLAAPPSRIYRLKKLVRRNRGAVAAASVAGAALVLGVSVYIHGIRVEQHKTEQALADARAQRAEAEKQKVSADQQRDEARRQERNATSVSDFLSNMLSSADPQNLLGDKVTVVQAINAAMTQLDARAGTMDALTEASLRLTVGKTLRGLGRYDEAEPNLRKALGICRQALAASNPNIARTMTELAILLAMENKPEEAERLYRAALVIFRNALPANHPDIAHTLQGLGNLLADRNKMDEAETVYREALAIDRKALGANHPRIASDLYGLARLLLRQNNIAEAESLYRESLSMARKTLPAGHPDISNILQGLGSLLMAQNKLEDAETLFREALEINRKALPAGHPAIAYSLVNLAVLLSDRNKKADAEPLYREALDIRRKSLPAGHPAIAELLNNFGVLLAQENKPEEAEKLYSEALEIDRKALPAGNPAIARDLLNLAGVEARRNKTGEAEKLCREALQIDREALPADHPDIATILNDLAFILELQNNLREAEKLNREALAIELKSLQPGHPLLVMTIRNLSRLLDRTNRADEARALRALHGLPAATTRPIRTRPPTQSHTRPAIAGSTTKP